MKNAAGRARWLEGAGLLRIAAAAAIVFISALGGASAQAACVQGWVTGLSSQDQAVLVIEGAVVVRSQTRPGGQWEVCGLGPGQYRIRPENPQYQFNPPARTVAVREPKVQAVNFHAVPRSAAGTPGPVKGRVEGLRKGDVVLLELSCRLPVEGKSARGGVFSLQPREAGACRLIPRDDRYRFVPVEMELDIDRRSILNLYFAARPKQADALPLEVPDGVPVPAMERPAFRLGGEVKGLRKGEKAAVRVSGQVEREAGSDDQGRFSLPDLPAGRYRIEVRVEGCPGCRALPAGMAVELDSDVSGLSFQIQRQTRGR